MTTINRVVFDCKVLVSALIRDDTPPGQAFDRARKHCQIVTSESCLEELRRTLYKEKLARYFSRDEADLFLEVFRAAAVIVESSDSIQECRDPKDDKYLEAAVAAEADCIVSGDTDLLVLHPFRGILILTPRDFLGCPL